MSVRHASDPYEGFKGQLRELRGMVRIVPPLIEADRLRRWAEAERGPVTPRLPPSTSLISGAGEEEGYGYAPYDHTLYSTATVTSWETFHFYLIRVLAETCLRYRLTNYPPLAQLVTEERRKWDRNFDAMKKRFQDFAGVKLSELKSWDAVCHARELRNALVHNLGYYTDRYVRTKTIRCIATDDILDVRPSKNKANWVDHELIPLDHDFAEVIIDQLIEAGSEIHDAVKTVVE